MPSVLYVSYDGALDPLGSSQVVPYLTGLAGGARLTLLSFEKPLRWSDVPAREAMAGVLKAAGIEWRPLRYHAWPRLAATAWDVAKGARALNPRGELYTDANVGERLAMRNLMDDMRGGGRTMRGPSPITAVDRQAFANQLDRWLTTARPRQT